MEPSSTSTHKPVILLGVFILGTLLGAVTYSVWDAQSTPSAEQAIAPATEQYQSGYDQAILDATALLLEKEIISEIPSQGPTYTGEVTRIEPGTITLSYSSLNPLKDEAPTYTSFNYTDDTKTFTYADKNPEVLAAQVREWETNISKIQDSTDPTVNNGRNWFDLTQIYPLTFSLQPIDISSIEVGQTIKLGMSDEQEGVVEEMLILPTPEMYSKNPQLEAN
jgi:hypothetical protein